MTYEIITATPIAGALGAEVSGVDLGEPLSEPALADIRRAFADHPVLFFRDQSLDPEGQIAFAEQLGPLLRVPYVEPLTGAKALFINPVYVTRFADMTEAESKPLLDYLRGHAIRPEFTCRFSWRNGSLAFRDNRCTQHLAIDDYDGERRLLHRVTLAGERPIGS